VQATVGLRVTEEEEISGIDLTQHSEVGYSLSEGGGGITAHATGDPTPSHAPNSVPVPRGGEA
jgi:Amt family ammonium transporter